MSARAGIRALPNILSSSRVFLAFAFLVADTPNGKLGILATAAVTDFFDGWVARRAGITSRFGALLDPIADRFFVLVAVSSFLFDGTLGTVGYFAMISRDLMTAIGFLVARAVPWLRPIEFRARLSGKIVTGLQFAALLALIRVPVAITPLLWAVAVMSLGSVVDYTLGLWRERAR